MKIRTILSCAMLIALILTCTGFADGSEEGGMDYRTEEIRCSNGADSLYGVAYIPETNEKVPLVIFSHELGNSHTSGIRYAERLAQYGYAVYAFDFRGGSAPGTENRSSGSNREMSVLTEASDLEAVLEAAKGWDFVDSSSIYLLGGSQGGLVTIIAASRHPDAIKGIMLMYPALSAKEDHISHYRTKEEVPEEVGLFGGWMQVGRNYITDLWDLDFESMLSSYTGKVLLLHGDRDSTVPLSWSEHASEIIPDCEFHVISGGGHEFFGQPFEDAAGYILAWLNGMETKEEERENSGTMKMKIGDTPVEVLWENNESVEALKALAAKGLSVRMSMYGGFEQVGSIGQRLPSNDRQTTTESGDIVLYSSSQMVVFYGSNAWAYTRLGHITDKTPEEMRKLLGNGDVVITLTME